MMPRGDTRRAAVVEAERIYHAIFGGTAPQILVHRFIEPSRRLDAACSDAELARYRDAMAQASDLEALEVAARLAGRGRLLTRKFQLVTCLAENLPDHQRFFIADTDSWLRGAASVSLGALRTAFKLARGTFLLRRYFRA